MKEGGEVRGGSGCLCISSDDWIQARWSSSTMDSTIPKRREIVGPADNGINKLLRRA